jgi:hypothetical protein
MLIKNPKSFVKGLLMSAIFVGVLVAMFMPIFEGENAFRAADKLFNTISKGSTYYIPMLQELVAPLNDKQVDGVVKIKASDREAVKTLFSKMGAAVSETQDGLRVSVDLKTLLDTALKDADDMFHNRGEVVENRYGFDEKAVLFAWWNGLKGVEKALSAEKRFAEAKVVGEVLDRGISVGYNYYTVAPEKAADRWGVLTFALVFYVIYTLWWGFAVYLLFEGIGLQLTAGKKKEM